MIEVRGYDNLSSYTFDILLKDGEYVAQPVYPFESTRRDPNAVLEPTIRLDREVAQSLFQAMWDQGFRPAQGSSGKAEVDAQAKHIAFAEGVAHALLAHIQK